jgi:hypothetical protein
VKRILFSNFYGLYNPMSFQAAFTLMAVKSLQLEAGFLYPLPMEEDGYFLQRPLSASIAADYSYLNFNISGRTEFKFLEQEKRDLRVSGRDTYKQVEIFRKFEISARITPSYNFSFARLGMDFLAYYRSATECDLENYGFSDDKLHLGAAIWLEKRFMPGSIQVGLTFAMPTKWQDGAIDSRSGIYNETIKSPFVFTVPIIVSFYI